MAKKPADPRGQHTRLYNSMMDSPAWRALSLADRGLYVELRRSLTSFNNGNISAAMSTMRAVGVRSPTTLAKGLRVLQAVGLIARTREGGIALGQKVCTLFRFTDEPCFNVPKLGIAAMAASNDWKQFSTIESAKLAIKAAEAPTTASSKTTPGLQKLERCATDSGVVTLQILDK